MKLLGTLGVFALLGALFGLLMLIGLPGLIIHYWQKYRNNRSTDPTDTLE